jgi:DNA-directed RNA polymerase subunit RPC12/RpoP
MSGWIDYFENEITCPHCKHKFLALFIEDCNCKDPPLVITSLASGQTKCPNCNIIIRDNDLTDTSFVILHID